MVGAVPRDAESASLSQTGFHKPLPVQRRVGRVWAAWGLLLGRRLATVVRDDHVILILMAAFVGVTSGGSAALLLSWIQSANRLFLVELEGPWRWAAVLLLPAIGGLAAGWLTHLTVHVLRVEPVTGPVGVIEAVAQHGGLLHGRAGIVAGIGTGVSIGSGGSCGHEGPSVAIGATVGSVLARFFGFRLRRQVAMVGAGCAGGLAAAFNAPLAGVIFTVELVFGGAIGGNVGTMSVFIPLVVAAVAGTFTSHAIFGPHVEFVVGAHEHATLPEYGFYVLLAIAAGVGGALFSRAVVHAFRLFRRLRRVPAWCLPALGGLGVGLIAVTVSTDVLGAGRGVVDAALHGHLGWQLALVLVVAKVVATALTLGSGGFGGAFTPSLVVGGCLGTLVGGLAQQVLGIDDQASSAYALVGMGAVFAGLMQAPLTPIVMLFELTHDYAIILPLMLACIIAVVVARRIEGVGFYRVLARERGIVLRSEAEGEVMKRGLVRDIMGPAERVLRPDAPLSEVEATVVQADLTSTFVVDADGVVLGYVNGDQLARRMLAGQVQAGSTAGSLMARSRLTLLYPADTLAGAMLAFNRARREVLPVVDDAQRLVGVIRRSDLIAHYSDKVLGEQQEVVQVHAGEGGHEPDQEVGLGKGIVLERVVVGRRWAGKTLSELALRQKAGVVVLEWRRHETVVAIDPHAPLREGDVVALVGTRREILRARELW